jgi:dTDP-4-amino-4,6-dideoxygalactose transaminase
MNIQFLDLKPQYTSIQGEIHASIQQVLASGSFVLGKPVLDFENRFSEAHSVKHCIGVSSGTDANHLSLSMIDIGPGDEVIIPVNTFIATAWGATLCGSRPVFVDCHPESYNIDPLKIERAITKKTKAIVAVHLYGQATDMQPLQEIARRHDVHLVEDAAQAHLAEYNGKKVGGIGISAAFSFYPGKNLGAYGEAGALTTNDNEIARKARMFRDQGQSEKYHHDSYGHNYRMEAIQGAVLGVKLKYLPQWTAQRRAVAGKYRQLLGDLEQVSLPKEMPYAKHVYHLFVIRARRRDDLKAFLEQKGIGTGLHYPIPLHLQKAFQHLGYKKGDFPVAEKAADEILSLPMYPELTDQQIEYVCDSIREFYPQ